MRQELSYSGQPLRFPGMAKRPETRQTLAQNLRYLMKLRGWSEADCAKHAKVSQKTVNNVLNAKHTTSIDTADALARAFGLTGWHLLLPNLPDDLRQSPSVGRLIESYVKASAKGRDYIDRVAEQEAKYGNHEK